MCVIDEDLAVLVQQKVANDLAMIDRMMLPYKEHLQIVVESTFNWYWLVDGLKDRGYDVCLAHTLGLYMITGAKVKTDRRDALALAKLLKAGMIPKAYICPVEVRVIRDLVRRRARVVQLRAGEYASMRRLLFRHGIIEHTRSQMRRMNETDLEAWFDHPVVRLHANQELERIRLYSVQIKRLESEVHQRVKDEPVYRRLLEVPGIDKVLATTIYYESGDIGRFGKAKQYSSYCRVVPGVAQSGQVTRRGRNANQGNHYLKWAFNQAASYAVRYYPKIRENFDRILRTHHGRARKLIAYNAIAHKLAVAVFHMMRDGEVYREELLFGQ